MEGVVLSRKTSGGEAVKKTLTQDETVASYRIPFKYVKAVPYGENMDGYEKKPWPVDAWRWWYYEEIRERKAMATQW